MSAWASERQQILERFVAMTSLVDDRVDRSPFGGPVFETPASGQWARLTTHPVPGSAKPMALGADGPSYREGLIVIEHYSRAGFGEEDLDALVDETNAIFHRQSFGVVVCREADPPDPVGLDESKEWHQANATIPYYVLDSS